MSLSSNKKYSITRVSTKRQYDKGETKTQRKYHVNVRKSKNYKEFIGSAYKKPIIIEYIKGKLENNNGLSFDFYSFDRFSRNVSHCKEFKKWLTERNKNIILIINNKKYDYCKDIKIICKEVKLGEDQSLAIGNKSRLVWSIRKQKDKKIKIKTSDKLNKEEEYFVKQIIFSRDVNGKFLTIPRINIMMNECGVKRFSKKNISTWRNELEEPNEYITSFFCDASKLNFAYPGTDKKEDGTWEIYKKFFINKEVAEKLSEDYPYNNGVWKSPSLNMIELGSVLNEIIDDEIIIDNDPLDEPPEYSSWFRS